MKFTALIILLFSLNIFANGNIDSLTLEKIRTTFYAAVEDEDKLYELEELIHTKFNNNSKSRSGIILAYIGGIEALKAKHAFNPVSKLSYLLDALDILEESIKIDPDKLEIRFMRFSILHHVPGILGYGSERDADKNSIVSLLKQKNYDDLSYDIQKGILTFMLESERLNPSQQTDLEKLLTSMAINE